jgi:hypothetical protein
VAACNNSRSSRKVWLGWRIVNVGERERLECMWFVTIIKKVNDGVDQSLKQYLVRQRVIAYLSSSHMLDNLIY